MDAITAGVRTVLDKEGVPLDIVYMDTKRKTSAAWKAEASRGVNQKLSELKPAVVITADDNAQEFFAVGHLNEDLPFVFCGVNADPGKYGFPASNVTGIIERPHFADTLALARSAFPVKRIAMLSSDDPTSRAALSFMKQALADIEVVSWDLVGTFDEWKRCVRRYEGAVDAFGVYMYHTVREEKDGLSLEPKTVMEWTIENTRLPTLGFFEFGVEDGLLLGVVESGEEHGEKAARYAVAILRGEPVENLPILRADVGTSMVNRKTAARLGVELGGELLRGTRVVPEE